MLTNYSILLSEEEREKLHLPKGIKVISFEEYLKLINKPKEFKQTQVSLNNLLKKDGTNV